MKKTLLRFATVALAAGGLCLGLAQEAPSQPPQAPPAFQRLHARLAEYLNLTPDQESQFQATMQNLRASAQPVRQQLKQLRAQMFQAIQANNTAQIDQISAQEGNLRGQLAAMRNEAFAKIYSSLTPDQKAKADQLPAMLQQMRQRRMQHRMSQNPNNG